MDKKICLIIGFGPGVGLGVAKAFGALGYSLALLSRNPQKSAAQLAELKQLGYPLKPYTVDAGDESSLRSVIALATADLGPVEVLIYNAVAPTFVSPTQLTAEKLVEDFRVNVAGALAATLEVLPAMRELGKGTILFTGGGWSLYPWHVAASPSIGKSGIRSLAYTLGQELAESTIHVGTVTILGEVKADTHFSPDKIAQAYVELHQQTPGNFTTEIQYK